MKDKMKTTLSHIRGDRVYLSVLVGLGICVVAYIVWSITTIQFREVQIVNQSTSFGQVKYYKDKWYVLYALPVALLFFTIFNAMIIAKFHAIKRRAMAAVYSVLSFFLIFLFFAHTYQILRIAYDL